MILPEQAFQPPSESAIHFRAELLNCISGVKRLGDPRSLVHINALAILGRLLQMEGLYVQAASTLEECLSHLDPCPTILRSYRLGVW